MIEWTEEKLIEAGYKIQNARITHVDLSTEDHACACLEMTLEGGGWGVVYGGYKLGTAGTYLKREDLEGSAEGMEAILYIMHTVGVDSLVGMKNQYVRVATKGWGDSVKIIGNVIKDEWFDYGSFFEGADSLEKKLGCYSPDELKEIIFIANRMLGGMEEL